MRVAFLVAVALFAGTPPVQTEVDVPAVSHEVPAPYPCNIAPKSENGAMLAVCITGPETHWTCSDKSRVLLESEDGVKHCVDFKLLRSR